MLRLSKVLVASSSSVLREVLRLVLRPHTDEVATAGSRREARSQIAAEPFQLLITDVVLPDGDGFDLLCDVAALECARPDVILVSPQADFRKERRAVELGALGYLIKPIAFRDISRTLMQRSGVAVAERRSPRRPGGRACVLDLTGQEPATAGVLPQFVWSARNVSRTGAFLETEAPLEPGTALDLVLDLAGRIARVRAEVVRVQEPGWGRPGGVGVCFVELAPGAEEILEAFVAAGQPAGALS